MPVTAGLHQLGVTFLKNPSSLLETKRQPYLARYNMHRHPRLAPAIYQVSINGPYESEQAGRLAQPPEDFRESARDTGAKRIHAQNGFSSTLMRRAYRRPVTARRSSRSRWGSIVEAKAEEDFESGIEAALSAVLVSPEFLFRIEQDPQGVAPGTAYRISDLALASRLSFFLWSSIPDDELLATAERGELQRARGARDSKCGGCWPIRARAELVSNFADQWLHLRNLESTHAGSAAVSRISMTTCARLSGARRNCFFETHPAGRPQRAGSAEGGLHFPERTAREALRNPARVRQPLPPRGAGRRTATAVGCSARAVFSR